MGSRMGAGAGGSVLAAYPTFGFGARFGFAALEASLAQRAEVAAGRFHGAEVSWGGFRWRRHAGAGRALRAGGVPLPPCAGAPVALPPIPATCSGARHQDRTDQSQNRAPISWVKSRSPRAARPPRDRRLPPPMGALLGGVLWSSQVAFSAWFRLASSWTSLVGRSWWGHSRARAHGSAPRRLRLSMTAPNPWQRTPQRREWQAAGAGDDGVRARATGHLTGWNRRSEVTLGIQLPL